MIHVFDGNTADEVWVNSAKQMFSQDMNTSQPSRGGKTQEILHAAYCIRDPRQRWVISRQPALNPAFAIAEVIWILCGRNDSLFLNFWNNKLPNYSGHVEYYHGAYGYRLRQLYGIDQLDRAYRALLNNSDGRQVVLQIWHPLLDFPKNDGAPVSTDVPCNIVALLKVRKNKLEWTQILRSNDLIRGVPYNFIQFTSIQEVLAGWLGVDVGSYNHFSDSLHIYDSDKSKFTVKYRVNVTNNDSLSLPKVESDIALGDISRRIEVLIDPQLTKKKLEVLMNDNDLHPSYNNLFTILAAETARRRAWIEIIDDITAKCTNPMLNLAWRQWYNRFQVDSEDITNE